MSYVLLKFCRSEGVWFHGDSYKVLVLLRLSQLTSLDLSQKWTFTHPLISIELSYEVTRPHKLTSFDFYTKFNTNTITELDSVQFWIDTNASFEWTFIHLYKDRAFYMKRHTPKNWWAFTQNQNVTPNSHAALTAIWNRNLEGTAGKELC